jgi:hypothetical protein
MEIFIIVFSALAMPIAIGIGILIMVHKYSQESERKNKLMNTMENLIETKNKMIKALKSLRL